MRDTATFPVINGKPITVDVRTRIGAFVIHRPIGPDEKQGKARWTVTHARTGAKAGIVQTLGAAEKLAGELDALGGWDQENPTHDHDLIARAWAIVQAAGAVR